MRKTLSLALLMFVALVLSGQAATWNVDKAHSSIGFKVSHMVISKVNGNFKQFDGTIEAPMMDEKKLDLENSAVSMTVDVASIDTDNEDRDKHLRSEDFFDVVQYPSMTFVSKEVIPQEGNKFKLVGDLTIKDVTKEVTFDGTFNGVVTDPWGNTKAGFSAETTINRQDFNVEWNKTLDAGGLVVGDDVEIMIEMELAEATES